MILVDLTLSEAIEVLRTLVFFVLGMVVYAIFIFKFYRFLARKDIFKLNLDKYNKTSFEFLRKVISVILYLIEYVLFVPIFTFFWFAVLTVLITFLAREQLAQNILLVSIALVSAVRITAYYNEELSRDLAKMLPFALLGIYLLDASYFSFSDSIAILKQIPSLWQFLIYYLIFAIALEFILRIASIIVKPFISKRN